VLNSRGYAAKKMASPIIDLSWCDVAMLQWKYWGKTVISRIFIAYCFSSHPDVGALSDGCYVSMEHHKLLPVDFKLLVPNCSQSSTEVLFSTQCRHWTREEYHPLLHQVLVLFLIGHFSLHCSVPSLTESLSLKCTHTHRNIGTIHVLFTNNPD
jgi:hypothetical protein